VINGNTIGALLVIMGLNIMKEAPGAGVEPLFVLGCTLFIIGLTMLTKM